ncbi:MAG: outer membrane beta-barrel protein [Crocinitomicaceae bacterium]
MKLGKDALSKGKRYVGLCLLILLNATLQAQDTLMVKGNVDLYYGFNIQNTNSQDLGIYVSSNTLHQLDINYAAVEITKNYKDNTFYLSPAFGRYMTNNYRNEIWALRWLAEAFWQRNLSKNQQLTVGVFSSPFSPENWKSNEQLFYSRALAPEYVPYYLAGMKWKINCTPWLTFTPMLVNGWQHISDRIPSPAWSSLTELKWKNCSLNWTSFLGKEEGLTNQLEWRVLNDLNGSVKINDKLIVQSCVYLGQQRGINNWRTWWQMNSGVKVKFNELGAIGLRGEILSDSEGVFFDGISSRFSAVTGGWDVKLSQNLVARLEVKRLRNRQHENTNWFGFLNLSLAF